MIIKDILSQLETATNPVAKLIQHNEHFKVVVIALKAGMTWKEHKANLPTRLVVVEGSVIYQEGDKNITLEKHDDFEIPVNIIHALHANEDSICFIIQG